MMQNQLLNQNIAHYIGLIKRGKYFVILSVVAALIIGCAVAFKLPSIYRSEVKILYLESQLADWAKVNFINIYLEAMLLFMEAQAFSSDNAINAIRELDLYPDLIDKIPMTDTISKMRDSYKAKPIYTQVPGTGGRTEDVVNGFEFYFEHQDPEKAFQVANMLTTSFLENYRKFRESFASSASGFFVDERERLKEEITELDQKIADFKEKNINELPELFSLNYGMSDRLTQRLFSVDQQIMVLNEQRRSLEANLATMSPLIAMQGISGERIVTPEEKIVALKAELGVLLSSYSEKHPDIIRVRHEIAELEKAIVEKEDKGTKSNSEKKQQHQENKTGAYNPAYINLATQLEQVISEIEKLKKDKDEAYNDLIKYETRVAKTPMVEKEYGMLKRDLDNAKRRYDDLTTAVMSLESGAAMEKREMGGKLTIGQPPSYPFKPIRPNRPLVIAGFFIFGVMLGIGLLLGWDYMTQTVRTPQDFLLVATDIPVLSVVPLIVQEKQKGIKISFEKLAAFVCLGVVVLVLILIDTFYMNIDVLFIKIFSAVRTKLLLLGF